MIDYDKLLKKLDNEINTLSSFSPKVSGHVEPRSTGFFITEGLNVERLSQNQLKLVHAQLHMLYANRSGRALSRTAIKTLHGRVVERLQCHSKFDRLDD